MSSQNFGTSFPMQFQPIVPQQQGQPFMTVSSTQQFHPATQGLPPGQNQLPQFSQPMQQLPSRPPSYIHPNVAFSSGPLQYHGAATSNNLVPGLGSPGVPFSSAYTFQPVSQIHAPSVALGGQSLLPSGSQGAPVTTPVQQAGQPSTPVATMQAASVPSTAQETSSKWQEYTATDGRRYYHNKITKQSCWEKPLELMTPMERADASTVWKEFTTAEGKKYYYNKDTKQSKWQIPEELKLARDKAEKEAQEAQSQRVSTSSVPPAVTTSAPEQPLAPGTSVDAGVGSSPVAVKPLDNVGTSPSVVGSESSAAPVLNPATSANAVATSSAAVHGINGAPVPLAYSGASPMSGLENPTSTVANSIDGASVQDLEEAKKGMAVAGKVNVTPLEEKTVEDEHLVYATKQDAKNAFKSLLELVNVEADWTWEQAMRLIINDKRYGALKTLGERKQAFNEYLMQRKKLEAEERRLRQRKAKEEFTKMLEECVELTSSIRWSKAIAMFEDDERFKAVERASDREDLFENYMVDLQKKERIKTQEELRQNRLEYRRFLETCGLIKVDTQWRKVQDRLEDDERCSRLEKIDRLEIFQEYIRDLEKEEDEQKKLKKEQIKRAERKNRDEFRKMMEEHVAAAILTAKTYWRDYCQKVKDSAPYQAVASNTSGSTPKDLFEDVAEELDRQYHEDKTCVKDAMKLGKVIVASTWTYEDFRTAIKDDIQSPETSNINLELIFEDLVERAREKEEKEAKKRQRLANDFTELLGAIKEITALSTWEESKRHFEDTSEYRSMGEESFGKEIFEGYIAHLLEKAKEKERKREEEKAKKEKEREDKEKRKEKERREKDKQKERERERERGKERTKKEETDSENIDVTESYGPKEDKKREKDKERRHRKRHQHATDDVSSDRDDHEESKKSRRHSSDRKKSRKHSYTPESDSESRHKRHKRDHRDDSRKIGSYEELEDGELGEDGEIR